MVVKEFLANNGVDVEKFTSHRKNEPPPRRRLNKSFGGEITTPVPRTSAAIRETLLQKLDNGEYHLGEVVTPKSYKKWHPEGGIFHREWEKNSFTGNKEKHLVSAGEGWPCS